MRFTRTLLDSYIKHFPKKYIEKEKGTVPKKVFGNRFGLPDVPLYDDKTACKPEEYIYTEHRPWEEQAKKYNDQAAAQRQISKLRGRSLMERRDYSIPHVTPLPDEKWFWFRGDRVQVLVGKNKGRQGVVLKMVRERNWLFVEGLHCKYKFVQLRGLMRPMLSLEEQPLTVPAEVQLIDPKDLRPTDVEWRWNELGERVRVSLRTGFIIPMPIGAFETYDYKTPESYKENIDKDTTRDDVLERTYEPKLASFEEELMERYEIKDDRRYGKTYWY